VLIATITSLRFVPVGPVRMSPPIVMDETTLLKGLDIIDEARQSGALKLDDRETPWIEMTRQALAGLPDDEAAFIDSIMPLLDTDRCVPAEYELA